MCSYREALEWPNNYIRISRKTSMSGTEGRVMSELETETRMGQGERVEEKYNVIGSRQARYDANLKGSGSAVFGTDIHLSNMLYGKIFRGTLSHTRILKMERSKAE